MYISVVCFASWMIASCYKHSEPNYKLVSPVTHLTVVKPVALNWMLLHALYPVPASKAAFLPYLPQGGSMVFAAPPCSSGAEGRSRSGLQSLFSSSPFCDHLPLSVSTSGWESCRCGRAEKLVDSSFFLFLHYWEKMTWTLVKSLPLWWWRNNL